MRLLPSEKNQAVESAIAEFDKTGELAILQPCDCGSRIRHNNGGNYHDEIYLRRDENIVFVKYETTCELVAPAEWQICENPHDVITSYSDWL